MLLQRLCMFRSCLVDRTIVFADCNYHVKEFRSDIFGYLRSSIQWLKARDAHIRITRSTLRSTTEVTEKKRKKKKKKNDQVYPAES